MTGNSPDRNESPRWKLIYALVLLNLALIILLLYWFTAHYQ